VAVPAAFGLPSDDDRTGSARARTGTSRPEADMTTVDLHARLKAYFAAHAREPGPPAPLTGDGWDSSLYTFTLPPTVVLKLYPPTDRGRRNAVREGRALTRLPAAGYAVPGVVACEPDARHLGRPFVVMDHIDGSSLWRVYRATGSPSLVRQFVARLADLHALDPRLLEPVFPTTDPYVFIERELGQLRHDIAEVPDPPLHGVLQWLEQRHRSVPCHRPVILHRDYHPWNVVVDGSRKLWVLDWDWEIGDARFDLAWTCTLMERSGFGSFANAVRDKYVRRSDRPLDQLAYFEVLTTLRWLLNVLPAIDESFRAFVADPVRRARLFLQEQTG
jgi:aminoglycoside phosphotransferase (APT) family kinase protein